MKQNNIMEWSNKGREINDTGKLVNEGELKQRRKKGIKEDGIKRISYVES